LIQNSHTLFLLADELRLMNAESSLPRDLPGRYGRVIRDLERLFAATETLAVVAGGWAVWRHGFAGRVTEDVDVVVPQDKLPELNAVAGVCGFEVLGIAPARSDRWPKLVHRETGIDVDLLPEAGIPGTHARPALVAIQHPCQYAATPGQLLFVPLTGLIELKLGAARAKDIADIIELIHQNPLELAKVADYLEKLEPRYAARFQELIQTAADERG